MTSKLIVNNIEADAGVSTITFGSEISASKITTSSTSAFSSGLNVTGVSTFTSDVSIADKIIHTGDTNTAIRFPADDTITAETGGSERLRITSAGNVGINTANPASALEIVSDVNSAQLRIRASSSGNRAQMRYTNAHSYWETGISGGTSGDFLIAGSTEDTDIVFYTRASGANQSEKIRIDSSGRLLIGTVTNLSASANRFLQVSESNPFIIFHHNGNNPVADTTLAGLEYGGQAGGSYVAGAFIRAITEGAWASGDAPTRLVFSTTADGESSPTERMRITQNGRFHFSSNTADSLRYGNTNNNSISSSTAGQWAFVVENNSDTSPFGMLIDYDDASPDNTTNEFLRCTDSTATRVEIRSDGDIWTSDSGVLTSDATLKRDITDATPKLDDLMRLRVRNFYWTPEYHPNKQDKKLIGFIAQEVEEVFPGLVSNDNRISGGDPIYDEEGNDTGEKTPEVLKKGLKEAKLIPILVKALQEAVGRIETLEAKVAALENP